MRYYKGKGEEMAVAKYNDIYISLREKIENGEYEYQDMLPSEHKLIELYDCSRNTVRRAITELASNGYVQSIRGKGVQVIHQPREQSHFLFDGMESLKEASQRLNQNYNTKVIHFEELIIDEKLSKKTGFSIGSRVYYLQRVRYIEGEALIIDSNYFLSEIVKGLTKEIAEKSVYEYMENELKETVVTTKRKLTVERVSRLEEKYMDMKGYNSLVVVSSNTFNKDGIMFEYTISRHRPDRFVFYENAQRLKKET